MDKKETGFNHPSGEIIYLFTLTNNHGSSATITNYGATITSFIVRGKTGIENDVVLGFERVEDYTSAPYTAQYPWFGCAVGRYANRIKNAAFSLDGKHYQLSRNNGENQLHGGVEGFDRKAWKVVRMGHEPCDYVELAYRSVDGEEGYPGNLDVTIRFELTDENELIHYYEARTDAPTPVNLTHHSYFNLANGQGTIYDHELRIPANEMLAQDEGLVATGEIVPVENTVYDFRSFHRIGEKKNEMDDYDRSFIVAEKKDGIKLMAEARYGGWKLEVLSTEPILHFYSGKWTPLVQGKYGLTYGPYSGFCLETHGHTNAVNIEHFPNSILRPGEVYRQTTLYRVSEI